MSALTTLVEQCTKIAKRIKELSEAGDVPGVFRDLESHLPLFETVLEHTPHGNNDQSPKTEGALAEIVRQCSKQIDQLKEILRKVRIEEGDSFFRRTIKASISLMEEKPAQKIVSSLMANFQLLKFLSDTPAVQPRPKVERWLSGPLRSYMRATTLFFVPFSRDQHFVGRESHLQSIASTFEFHNRVAICGIGGVG